MSKCLNCDKELKGRPHKYCDAKCQQEYQRKVYIQKWQNGEEDGMRGDYQLSTIIRAYLFEKYDNQCALCGWHEINPITGKIPLEVDHIDGDYHNNVEENLILICPNCHSLSPTYKALNKGAGRKERKKYY